MKLTVVLMLSLTCAGVSAAQGWKDLFDGKTLNGWEGRPTFAPESKGDWIVKDGAIVCGGTKPSWLSSKEHFGDFQLKLEFRGADNVNSGVFLRSQEAGQPHQTGYELQIWDYQPAGFLTGSLVGSVKAGPAKVKGGEWNTFDVTAKSDHFTVLLNGNKVLDASDAKHKEGVIGFQCQLEQKIEFRKIQIRALK